MIRIYFESSIFRVSKVFRIGPFLRDSPNMFSLPYSVQFKKNNNATHWIPLYHYYHPVYSNTYFLKRVYNLFERKCFDHFRYVTFDLKKILYEDIIDHLFFLTCPIDCEILNWRPKCLVEIINTETSVDLASIDTKLHEYLLVIKFFQIVRLHFSHFCEYLINCSSSAKMRIIWLLNKCIMNHSVSCSLPPRTFGYLSHHPAHIQYPLSP